MRILWRAHSAQYVSAKVEKPQRDFHLKPAWANISASLVVATGGPSIPTFGASAWGYELAQQSGLNVIAPRAALVPLLLPITTKPQCSELWVMALPVCVTVGNQSFCDDMLFTHRGLSGPAMLQISLILARRGKLKRGSHPWV